MNLFIKQTALSAFVLALTACGGKTITSNDTEHPDFIWAAVATSQQYAPTGNVSEAMPTFTWVAKDSATEYNFGHSSISGADWIEYTVSSDEACDTGSCSYTPDDVELNVGDQRAWWVRSNVNGAWQAWSETYVFSVTDSSGGNGNGNVSYNVPSEVQPINGASTKDDSPYFVINPVENAKKIQIGLEKHAGANWYEFSFNAKGNCPPATECPKTTFRPYKNFDSGDYTWYVRALLNDGSWTEWSQGAEFSIIGNANGSTQTPDVIGPFGLIGTNTPTLTWSRVNGAQYDIAYEIEGSTNSFTMIQNVNDEDAFTCTSNTVCVFRFRDYRRVSNPAGFFKSGDRVFWWVRANNGEWQGGGKSFTVN